MNELLKHLRTYLEWAQPEHRWESASFDALLDAAEEASRLTDAINTRRSRKISLVLALAVLALVGWFVMRRLTGR